MRVRLLGVLVVAAILGTGCSGDSQASSDGVADEVVESAAAAVSTLTSEETYAELESAWAGYGDSERASWCRRYAIDTAAFWRDVQAEYPDRSMSLTGFDSFAGDRCTEQGQLAGESQAGEQPTTEDSAAADSDSPQADSTGMSRAQFAVSARGDAKELLGDATDAEVALDQGGTFRLISNGVEMSFNLGQLQALDPPKSVASDWNRELKKLDRAVEAYSDAVGGDSVSQIQASIDDIKKSCKKLIALAERAAG